MKNIVFFSICIFTLVFSVIVMNPEVSRLNHDQMLPLPKGGLVVGEGEEEQKKFNEWYEKMHRTAPGTNWRAIEATNRYQRYLDRKNKPFYRTATQETLANGNLIGEWKEKGSVNQSGRIHIATKDTVSGKIYAGSSGGNIWRGNSNGTGWTVLNDRLQFNNIMNIYLAPNGAGQRIIVPVGGANLWFSDDDGASWSPTAGLSGIQSWGWFVRSSMANDTRKTIYMLGTQWDYVNWWAETVLYRSTDKGLNFTQVISWDENAEGTSERFDIYSPTNGDTCTYLLHDGVISKLNYATGLPDSLSSFTLNSNGFTMLTGAVIGGTNRMYAYVNQDVYKSADGGMTWNFISDINMNPFFRTSFSASLTSPDLLYFGDVDCHRSTDAGQTWNIVNSWVDYYGNPLNKLHADIPSIKPFFDNGMTEKTFIGTDGGLFISSDLGQTVTNLSMHGLNVSQYYTSYTHRNDPDYIYAGAQDQGYQRCQSDSGTVLGFQQIISGDYAHMVSPNGGTILYMTYPGTLNYIAYAPTGGITANWNYSGYGFPLWLPPLMTDPENENKIFIAGGNLSTSGSRIIHATVSGTNITATEGSYDFNAGSGGGIISALEFSPMDSTYRYVATDNGKFFLSTDGGSSWNMTAGFDGPGSHYFYGNDIHASSITPGLVFVGGSGYSNPGFWKSTNHGQSFTDATSGLPATLIFDLAANYDESLIFAATEAGPYVYVVAEDHWYDMSGTNAPDQTYWEVDYIPATNTARFCTYGRGLWDFAISYPVFTSIQPGSTTPAIQIYPNPVSETFTVDWGVALTEASFISVYDLNGKKIYEQPCAAGSRQVVIHCSDFPPGMYICELKTNKNKWAGKVVIR